MTSNDKWTVQITDSYKNIKIKHKRNEFYI